MKSLKIAFFGSSLVSAYWNGAATYYRGLLRALAEKGHRITFYEPDAFERQQHRDMPDPDWARVVVYRAEQDAVRRALGDARGADVVVKASGVGVFDDLLEEAVLELRSPSTAVVYCDVDAPATLSRVEESRDDAFAPLIPQYDLVITYGGGEPIIERYRALGARRCKPIYNAFDQTTHFPVAPDKRFEADLGFLGNRMPDREERVEEFFFRAAALRRDSAFLLGGSGWDDRVEREENVRYLGHVYTRDHNPFNCTPRVVLNVSRESMVRNGWSPATRVFEAAGAGACLITDDWEGLGFFLEPGLECIAARDGEEVAAAMDDLSPAKARAIGAAARRRVLAEHTYRHRADTFEEVIAETILSRLEAAS
jgi:spore maturation protein CgeB